MIKTSVGGNKMSFTIPAFLIKDEYIQTPVVYKFSRENKIKRQSSVNEAIREIEKFADESEENRDKVISWINKVVEEGSKEICYERVFGCEELISNPNAIDEKIHTKYPDCPFSSVATYKNNGNVTLINYKIHMDENSIPVRISFVFSQLLLCEESREKGFGEKRPYPVIVEVYLQQGFVISRQKSKSTLYKYSENPSLMSEDKINTIKFAKERIDEIIVMLGLEKLYDKGQIRHNVYKTIYNMYKEYTFTPQSIIDQVNANRSEADAFVKDIFDKLDLQRINEEKAVKDILIFFEKFLSINGNNENQFMDDRQAFVIQVSSDYEEETTRIETNSSKERPLQSTEAFFDSKKSIENSKVCKKMRMNYKRTNPKYFSQNPLIVEFGFNKVGYIKTMSYAEEEDIQNVLQDLFKNYP